MAEHLEADESTKFKQSKNLKRLYLLNLEHWKRKHRLAQEDLAERCGVTPSYLSQIGRYGRIPSKPVLILLALHFELKNPNELFEAAEMTEAWPLEPDLRLMTPYETEKGFLSVKLDMQGFTDTIREIVRSETKPKTVRELSRGAPLRVGYNTYQKAFFSNPTKTAGLENNKTFSGAFPELTGMLGLALHSDIQAKPAHYIEAFDKLKAGELDIFGPVFSTPERLGLAIYTIPLCRVGISVLWRKVHAPVLRPLPPPRNIEDLLNPEYTIAVLRDSISHHFAAAHLRRRDEDLIICDSREEVLERLILSGIPRPAHLVTVDSLTALQQHKEHRKHLELLFGTKDTFLSYLENVIAVRPDWPELASMLSETIHYGRRTGTLARIFNTHLSQEFLEVIDTTTL